MTNIIKLLKDNEKPFILMSEEMQAKLMQVAPKDIECLQAVPGEVWAACGPGINWGPKPCTSTCTFRLRADYEEKPEIVECEIFGRNMGCLQYNINQDDEQELVEFMLEEAVKHPDFIGFKFGDGGWYDAPIKPVGPDGKLWSGNVTVDDIISGRVKILHATHVLLRKKE